MARTASIAQPTGIYPSRRRLTPGRVETAWDYVYRVSDQGDGTGGTQTISVIPPAVVAARNRIWIRAVHTNNDTGAILMRFRVFLAASAVDTIYACTFTSVGSATVDFWTPPDLMPRDIPVPDAAPALELELQTANVNLQTVSLRAVLHLEAFEPA